MKKKIVTIEFEIPDDVSDADFEEWVKFVLYWNSECSSTNKLLDEQGEDAYFYERNFDIRDW